MGKILLKKNNKDLNMSHIWFNKNVYSMSIGNVSRLKLNLFVIKL